MEKRRWSRLFFAGAVVLGFHVTVIWLLLGASRIFSLRAQPQSLELVNIAHPTLSKDADQKDRVPDNASPRHRGAPKSVIAPSRDESNAVQPLPDWTGELSRAAADAAEKEMTRKPTDFGFPHSPPPPAETPQFGWDYAATHRVEQIPEGGILIHINDNCVLVFFPLPLVGCSIGKRKPNGDLFQHMHDTSPLGDPTDPK